MFLSDCLHSTPLLGTPAGSKPHKMVDIRNTTMPPPQTVIGSNSAKTMSVDMNFNHDYSGKFDLYYSFQLCLCSHQDEDSNIPPVNVRSVIM